MNANPRSKSAPYKKWLILSELLLALLPLSILVFSQILHLETQAMLTILITSIISALASFLSIHEAAKSGRLDDPDLRVPVLFLIPTIQYGFLLILLFAFGWEDIDISKLTTILMGLMFIVMGNILPKTTPNPTFGIRVKWALQNRENWRITSRLSGIMWVVCGLLLWISVLLNIPIWIALIALFVIALSPVFISWNVYRKQKENGTWTVDVPYENRSLKASKTTKRLFTAITVLCLIFVCGSILFGGNYKAELTSSDLKINAAMAPDTDIPLSSIESVELTGQGDIGVRVFGYSFMGTNVGSYRNDEFGSYKRYTAPGSFVIEVKSRDGVVVFSLKNEKETQAFFDKLKSAIETDNR